MSESHDGSSRCLRSDINGNQINIGHDNSFTFDNVFPEESSQEEIYDACVLPLVGGEWNRYCVYISDTNFCVVLAAFFEGFNATVLAYGQTASGKTYTMGSASNLHLPEKEYGIIPRVVNDIFQNIKRSESRLVSKPSPIPFIIIAPFSCLAVTITAHTAFVSSTWNYMEKR